MRFLDGGGPLAPHFVQLAAGHQLVHRADQVFDVHDQHRRTVFHKRAGADVLDLAEARVERLHDQFTLAEKTVRDHPVGAAVVAHDDDRQLVADELGFATFQHLMSSDKADLPAIKVEMLAAFEQLDPLSRQLERADDVSERKGVRLAADIHQQGANDRERERQLQQEARPLAGLRRNADGAAHLLDHVLHDIEPDAAPRNLRDGIFHREAGKEEELQQLGFAQFAGGLSVGEIPLYDRLAQFVQVDAAAVVRHDDLQHTGAVAGFEVHDSFGRLAGGAPLLRRFDAVIDGVAQQMAQWRVEFLQNVPVHLRRLPDNLQPCLLAQRAAQIAYHPRKALNAVGERSHAAGQRLVVKPMRQIGRAAVEQLQFAEPLRQELLALENSMLGVRERGLGPLVQRLLRQGFAQAVHCLPCVVMQPLEPQQ